METSLYLKDDNNNIYDVIIKKVDGHLYYIDHIKFGPQYHIIISDSHPICKVHENYIVPTVGHFGVLLYVHMEIVEKTLSQRLSEIKQEKKPIIRELFSNTTNYRIFEFYNGQSILKSEVIGFDIYPNQDNPTKIDVLVKNKSNIPIKVNSLAECLVWYDELNKRLNDYISNKI